MLDNTPILIGSGQVVIHEYASPDAIKSPVDLAASALKEAVADTGCPDVADQMDLLAMTRTINDSASFLSHPFGTSTKPPLSVAQRLGISPQSLIYWDEGGQSPQRIVNELAEMIFRGECELVGFCGSEATAAMKQAQRNKWQLDWSEDPEGEVEDRGYKELSSDFEQQHHITFPVQVYSLFENAWRHEHGLSVQEHQQLMGRLFEKFAQVAANNPYAQFPVARSSAFLAETTAENYAVTEPYNKWFVAQDAVNQSAGVILTSVGKARKLGIPESRWVYLHGYADANDVPVSERPSFSSSYAMKAVYQHALAMANKSIDDIDILDIYSCFPIAVLAACEALGISWEDERPLTVTGGLPFFGGPGNSYSLHAIAEMYQELCKKPGSTGLISANGGYLSKQSVGVYSTEAVNEWSPREGNAAQVMVDEGPAKTVLYPFEGRAIIETYSLVYKKSEPHFGLAMCLDPITGQRILVKASTRDTATLQELTKGEPIGREVQIRAKEWGCYFSFP